MLMKLFMSPPTERERWEASAHTRVVMNTIDHLGVHSFTLTGPVGTVFSPFQGFQLARSF